MAESSDKPTVPIHRKMSLPQGDLFKFKQVFDQQDAKQIGKVPMEKLEEMTHKMGYRMSSENLKAILSNNKLDEASHVTFEDFIKIIPSNEEEITTEEHRFAELRRKFKQYDIDQDGKISLEEAQWALQLEMQVTPQTALRLLNQFVKLDYERFADFYKQIQEKKLEIYDKFGKYDLDLDGMISIEEAHKVLHEELDYDETRSRAMVKKFDRNKDGLVSYMEFAEFYMAVEERKKKVAQAFQKFDTENNGYVTLEHATEILQGCLGFSEEKCKCTLEIYDKNKDGHLDYNEFLSFYTMIEEERQRLLLEFHKCDINKDGRISYEEFEAMLKEQNYEEDEISALIAGYDTDKKGFLNFEEFKKFLNFS